uniref:Uncharacterized protein n=1 Tax=Romanomermis culicivorax TaxID=13658 RepID=A0A915JG89_ROMCU
MNGFKPRVETFCSRLGTSRELMVTTFSAMRVASVMINCPMKWDWILLAFWALVRKTRSLTAKLCTQAIWSKYTLLTLVAFM